MRKLALFFLICLIVILLRWPPDELSPGCDYPLPYRIGEVDERFRLGPVTLREIVNDSAATWEAATGRDLFVYDAAADFTINLIFDERQSETLVRKRTTRRLNSTESSIKDGEAHITSTADSFETNRSDFELASAAYDQRLATYNADVAYWNQRGDISREARSRLDAERSQLRAMLEGLEAMRLALNQDAGYLKRLSAEHSQLVGHYNEGVETINSLPTTTVEFHSGVYQGDKIEIYQYWNKHDLKLVVAHELGHAIGIGHLEPTEAVMHFTRNDPKNAEQRVMLSAMDLDALERVCNNPDLDL
jgi:hypothetical protein